MKFGAKVLLLGQALVLAVACDRLQNIGKAPEFSPVGAQHDAILAYAPERSAMLAYNDPTRLRYSDDESSLWRSGPASLFGDRRARNLGDIVTVVIEIDDKAEIRNSSERNRSASEDLSIPSLAGLPQIIDRVLPDGASMEQAANLTADSTSTGDGSVRRNEKITLRVAATVTEILPNGHLVVQGNQEVRVNFELRDLQVAGVVRPEDISRRNEITYDKIAGARVSYGGRGMISDFQQPRYGQQAADILLPF